MKDPYQVLGVTKAADHDQIKRAYRRLAQKYHPDRNPDDAESEEMFKDVSQAYDIIGDETKRARFDRGEINAQGQPQGSGFGRTGRGAGGYTSKGTYGTGGFKFDDIFEGDDIFEELLKRKRAYKAGGRQHSAYQEGADVRYLLKISFEEAARGDVARVSLTNGKKLDVDIPPGITDGQTMRLKHQGTPGKGGGQDGDALVEIRIKPHAFYVRDGYDVRLDLPITLREAVLGAKITVPTVHGKVALTVPANSNSGTILRLKGKGIKHRNGQGDQIVKLKVVLPEKPDKQLESFVKHWRPEGDDPRKKAGME